MVMRHTPSVFVGSKNKGSKQGRGGERGEGRGERGEGRGERGEGRGERGEGRGERGEGRGERGEGRGERGEGRGERGEGRGERGEGREERGEGRGRGESSCRERRPGEEGGRDTSSLSPAERLHRISREDMSSPLNAVSITITIDPH